MKDTRLCFNGLARD